MYWKPIETAPFYRKVIVWNASSKTVEISRVHKQYIGHPEYALTHWMPLPEPPKGATNA